MNFETYCDESRPDLLSSEHPRARFLLIGSLWLPADSRADFKRDIHSLRNRHHVGGEFKWQKVSPSRLPFYCDLMNWFVAMGERLRFRCIVVEPAKVQLQLYHGNDAELGFYKFYYQLLHHGIWDFNEYSFFVDFKSNRRLDRLPVLQRCLSVSNLSSVVRRVQAIESTESVLMQMTDVLTGLAAYRLNDLINISGAKFQLLSCLERSLKRRLVPTGRGEKKFNVFQIDLRGGW